MIVKLQGMSVKLQGMRRKMMLEKKVCRFRKAHEKTIASVSTLHLPKNVNCLIYQICSLVSKSKVVGSQKALLGLYLTIIILVPN